MSCRRSLARHEYNGSVGGSDTYHGLNITPTRAYPGAASDQIRRRLLLRQQVFYKNSFNPRASATVEACLGSFAP